MNAVDRIVSWVIGSIFFLVVLSAAGPSVMDLIDKLIVLVLAVGLVVGLLRALWHFTNRW